MALLEATNVTIRFGGLTAVNDFNLDLQEGELLSIIGPNGAGKTTVFNMISGIYKPTVGDIKLEGESLVGLKPYEFTQKGVARTFQNIRLFGKMTVLDNVMVALNRDAKYNLTGALIRPGSFMQNEKEMRKKAVDLLAILNLDTKRNMIASNLPYGEQRRLEIARALAINPKVLLLDEPVAGMNTQEMQDIIKLIAEIREKFEISILLIEHHMNVVMAIADRIKVLDFGETIAEGKPQEIQNDPKVIEAYLGKGGKTDAGN